MSEKIYNDPDIGEVRFRKSARSLRIGIRVSAVRGVVVTLPVFVPFSAGLSFFMAKREWVLSAVSRQRSASRNVIRLSEEKTAALRCAAKKWLPERLSQLALTYGFTYNSLAVKNNRSNWGSCSCRDNINLNLKLMAVPEPLRDYVILHELSHLKHRNHGREFHTLLEKLCADRMSAARYEDERDEKLRSEILRLASISRASFPVSRVLEKMIKTYRIC